jgi:hypothetical protein
MSMAHPVPAPAETVVAPAPAPDVPTTLFGQTTLHVVKAASPVTGPAAPMPASRSSINSGTWYKESHAPKPLLLTYNRDKEGAFQYDETPCKDWCGLPNDNSTQMQCGVFWFLHVPKTGGTNLASFLKERARQHGWAYANMWKLNLSKDEKGDDHEVRWKTWNTSHQWQTNVVKQLKTDKPRIIIHDHHLMPGLNNPYMQEHVLGPMARNLEARGCELRFATILREPIGHAMSRVRNEFATESVHDRFHQFSSQMSNSMAKYVVYNFASQWPEHLREYKVQPQVDEDLLRNSSIILANFDLVGRTEDMEGFVRHVRQTLGWAGTVLRGEEKNSHQDFVTREIEETLKSSSSTQEAARELMRISRLDNTLWESEEKTLREHNALDSRLYREFCASRPYSVCEQRHAERPNALRLFADIKLM